MCSRQEMEWPAQGQLGGSELPPWRERGKMAHQSRGTGGKAERAEQKEAAAAGQPAAAHHQMSAEGARMSLERTGEQLWRRMREHPVAAGMAAAVGAAMLASAIGAAEVAVECAAGYGAFRLFRASVTRSDALRGDRPATS
jgi:hypothetical protein